MAKAPAVSMRPIARQLLFFSLPGEVILVAIIKVVNLKQYIDFE